MSDPSAASQVRSAEHLLRGGRDIIAKRRVEIYRTSRERRLGPQGELRSETIARTVEMIELEQIHDDPDFQNVRLQANEEEMALLVESMRREGIKIPVELVESSGPRGGYHVRAGFRRTAAARRLRWTRLPALVLPGDTPVIDEYWTNIIENSARSKLTTYEVACAARTMRDKFQIPTREFALRAGYSESYVGNLLRCLDRLPPEIIDVWRDGAPIPIDVYHKWSGLRPEEAIREMHSYRGHNPKTTRGWKPPPGVREKYHPARMASAAGLSRMQRLRIAAEISRDLSESERTLCIQVVDYCSGATNSVPGIYEPTKKPVENPATPQPPEDVSDAAELATQLPPKKD
jgi:ParB/RepB/Spo0J family partition protein